MKRMLLMLLIWLGISECRALERCFSLDSCIRYALTHRTEIAVSENSGKNIMKVPDDLQWQQLPDLNGAYAHQMNWGRSLNTEKYEWEDSKNQYGNLSLSSSLTLFAGMRLRNQIRAGRLNVARNESVHRKLQNDIRLEVIQAYYELLAARAQQKLADAFYEQDLQQVERMKLLDSVRRVARPDQLELMGQAQKTGMEKQRAEKQCRLAMMQLRTCMNYRETEEIPVTDADSLIRNTVPSVVQVYRAAISTLPDVRMQYYDSLLLRNQWKQLRGYFSPVLSLEGMLYTRYQNHLNDPVDGSDYSGWKQLKDNNYKQAGISLSIPLFNHNNIRRQIREVRTEMLNQQLIQRKWLADIWDEVMQICLEAESRQTNCDVLSEQEKNYREIYDLRQIQYSSGKLSVYDLLTAGTNWRNVQANLLVERYNLYCYLEMIDFYMIGGKE